MADHEDTTNKGVEKKPEVVAKQAANPGGRDELALSLLADILGRPVRANADFFALGGNSVVAMEWTARLRTEAQLDLSPVVVLTAVTVGEALAQARAR